MVTLTACLVPRAQPCGLWPSLLVMLQLLLLGHQGHRAGDCRGWGEAEAQREQENLQSCPSRFPEGAALVEC